MGQHYVFIMDSPDTVLVNEDTTFALMLEAQRRGHRVDHCLIGDLFLRDGLSYARTARATLQTVADDPMILEVPQDLLLDDVDAVFIRKDPPFDSDYLYCTQMLEHLRSNTLVINRPAGLRAANEKLYACLFPELMPQTLVTGHKARIKAFVDEVGGHAVIKPLDGAGGTGVLALMAGDLNLNSIIETVTGNGRRLAMVQAFLPEVMTEGDKRILLLDSQPLGAILRVPQRGDVRSNIHVGGRVVSATLTEQDHRIIRTVGPRLREDGLYFVGLDVIGGKLTEVNVTSPTGIQQMERLDHANYCGQVIAWVEAGGPAGRSPTGA